MSLLKQLAEREAAKPKPALAAPVEPPKAKRPVRPDKEDPTGFESRYAGAPVGWSADLGRIIALPKRDLATAYTQADVDALHAELSIPATVDAKGRPTCNCASFKPPRPCPTKLRPVQAQLLLELRANRGALGPMGTGHGKELVTMLAAMVMPDCERAVLLNPASLMGQFHDEWHYYGGHWKLPNLAGGKLFIKNRPVVTAMSYNKLSDTESSGLLKRIAPDFFILNEAQNLKDPNSVRTDRFLRYFDEFPHTRVLAVSGTFASKDIDEYAHIAGLALRDGSPLPRQGYTVKSWGAALNPSKAVAPPGALNQLWPDPNMHVRRKFRERRNATPGVVATSECSVDIPLIIRPFDPGPVPDAVHRAIAMADAGERPDGEIFAEELERSRCVRELSAGFYNHWRYPGLGATPPRTTPEKIVEWFKRRQAWNKRVRDGLKDATEGFDSPGILKDAALRGWASVPDAAERCSAELAEFREANGVLELPWVPWAKPDAEGKPLWYPPEWPVWNEIADTVEHETEAVFISDFLVKAAARWATEGEPGIVWTMYPELGARIATEAGIPFYGGGDAASDAIRAETGERSCVASIPSHYIGKNLQRAYWRNLVITPMSDGAWWEQLLARTHRPGQPHGHVEVYVALHTEEYEAAFATACERARFMDDTDGQPQRLLFARYEGFDSA